MQRAAQKWKPSHPLQRMMMTRRRPMNAHAHPSASAVFTRGAGGGCRGGEVLPFGRGGGGDPNIVQGTLGSWQIWATSSLLIAGGMAVDADTRCEPVTVTEKELEEEWDRFMISSMNPEEDDDEDEEDDEEEEDEQEEEKVEEQEEGEQEKEETIEEEEKEEVGNIDETPPTAQESDSIEPKSSSDAKTNEAEDPYETLPEQDEETTCTMCLINRQGPCRPVWRKFEACMKDHLDRKHAAEQKQQHEQSEGTNDTNGMDDNVEQDAATLGEECDKYYLPWLSCMKNHWQRYILISNDFYQKEIVDPIEKAVNDNNKLLFAGDVENDVDPNSFLDLKDWFQFRQSLVAASNDTVESAGENTDDADGEAGKSNAPESLSSPSSSDEDVTLIMAAATINLEDAATGREVAAAYIRDQDGTLLGFDQFTSLKKKRREMLLERQQRNQSTDAAQVTAADDKVTEDSADKEKEDISVKKEEEKEAIIPTVARCTFYLNPETSKSIQVFALYQDVSPENTLEDSSNTTETKQQEEDGTTENADTDNTSTSKSKPSETLYYSSLISLEDIQPPSNAT